MKKYLLATVFAALSTPALAADLPRKAIEAPPPVAAYNPFYIGLQVGIGFTREENVIATPGVAVGTPKLYPTSPSAGVAFGYLNNTSALAYGGEIYGDFNFSQQPLNCVAGVCAGRMRNTWDAGADLLFGVTLGQIIAATPSNAQPQNWRIPVVVPTSIMNNLQLLGSVGAYGRQAGLCANDVVTGLEACGSEWLGGLSVGGQIRFMASTQWDVAVKYHHDFINHTFTPAPAVPLFTNSVTARDQDRLTVGMDFHLSPL